ncbi:MAG: hypothetical protein M1299_13220 [Firmicutes bacterium]|nr:hypothetical protein [Bacillota bacterium]MCL5040748.1 hypothetical protein [Bacillota bacterium]
MCENGCAAVRYRTLRDILRRPVDDPELAAAFRAVKAYRPALNLALAQDPDGTWSGRLHTGDSHADPRSMTEVQFPRLIEYGWGRESEAVQRTAAFLRRLLSREGAADADYHDLASYMKGTRRRRYMVSFARCIAAGLLAHAGYGDDPAVVTVGRELLEAAYRFVSGPTAMAPVRGDPPRVVEAAYDPVLGYPVIPDLYLLQLFAYCPSLNAGEGRHHLDAVVDYVLGPVYDNLEERIGYVSLEGRPFVKGWKVHLPSPDELAGMGRWNYGLIVLEMFARIAPLARRPRLAAYLEWLRQWLRPEGLYDVPAGALAVKSSGPFAERVQLAPDWRTWETRVSDVTFRVLLIETIVTRFSGKPYPR